MKNPISLLLEGLEYINLGIKLYFVKVKEFNVMPIKYIARLFLVTMTCLKKLDIFASRTTIITILVSKSTFWGSGRTMEGLKTG